MIKKFIMRIVFLILILSCLLVKFNYAQGNTTVFGTVENASNDSIIITLDKYFLSKKQIIYKIPIKQNQFSIEFQLDRNRIIDFSYQGQQIQLYIEPKDNLELKFVAGQLSETIIFSGKAEANNQFLKIFDAKFKDDFSSNLIEEKMKSLSLDLFEISLFDNRKNEKEFYKNYSGSKLFSSDFKIYIENKIKYNYLNFLLSFPIVNANKSTAILSVNPLPAIILDVLDKKNVSDNGAMICESYRNFLTFFVTYFASELNEFKKFKEYTISTEKKYVIARDFLKEQAFLYYLTKFLLENGEKTNPETVKRIYLEMVKEDKTGEYTGFVNEKLGAWMKTKLPKTVEGKLDIGSPEFTMQGFNKKELSLADYRGKVIYVDFWASWCGPCREQFPYSKMLHEQLSDKQKKEVIFLYISIDNTEEIWKQAVNNLKLNGEHALSPGGWNSVVAKYYQINSIPRYILIDKKGNVVNANATRPSDEGTLQDIIKLLN